MFLINPQVVPDLDPGFRPFALLSRALRIKQGARKVTLAIEQADGSVFHFVCYLPGGEDAHSLAFSQYLLMHNVRAALWVYGGYRVHIYGAPTPVVNWLKYHYYAYDVRGLFDADVMGEQVYFRKFEIIEHQTRSSFPEPRRNDLSVKLGGKGCYIGFDLGASNRRVVAVQDGQVVFEEDVEWLPVPETDPQFHYDGIMASLRAAAAKLPRVDGIGGSSAGVIVGNSTRIASLYRGVPRDKFRQCIVPQFQRMQTEFGGVPFTVVNDGEVAALAAAIEENARSVVGIALGSSTAGGFVTANGQLTTQQIGLLMAGVPLEEEVQTA